MLFSTPTGYREKKAEQDTHCDGEAVSDNSHLRGTKHCGQALGYSASACEPASREQSPSYLPGQADSKKSSDYKWAEQE